NHSITST
ncbi:uncharacterized protein CDAR_393791, partial [Caerostris darwini]